MKRRTLLKSLLVAPIIPTQSAPVHRLSQNPVCECGHMMRFQRTDFAGCMMNPSSHPEGFTVDCPNRTCLRHGIKYYVPVKGIKLIPA